MRLRVLIVEDSVDDAKLLTRLLTKEGFEVEYRRVDTQQAMRAALDEAGWDVILADHSMPQFSALAALDTMKLSGLDLPFIIVSGMIGEETAVAAMKSGAHDYILKGNMARLVPAIKRELAEATVRRERRQATEELRAAYAELELRVQERTAELAASNDKLTIANEELAAANEELAVASEELASASEQLRLLQDREIRALKELDRQKDEFLSIAAHELKTPITSLLGFVQTLMRQYEKQGTVDPERLSRALDVMGRQSRKLAKLVSQLLDLSRIEGGQLALQPERVDLARIVGEAANAARLSEPQREITVQAPPFIDAVVDPVRIEQVITNLVGNALRYSAGSVEIRLDRTDLWIEIAVRDHGPGIAPEHVPNIFDRFYRAHEASSPTGLGLGLYIANEIVALHGGRIRVEAPADGGALFVVSLPR